MSVKYPGLKIDFMVIQEIILCFWKSLDLSDFDSMRCVGWEEESPVLVGPRVPEEDPVSEGDPGDPCFSVQCSGPFFVVLVSNWLSLGGGHYILSETTSQGTSTGILYPLLYF